MNQECFNFNVERDNTYIFLLKAISKYYNQEEYFFDAIVFENTLKLKFSDEQYRAFIEYFGIKDGKKKTYISVSKSLNLPRGRVTKYIQEIVKYIIKELNRSFIIKRPNVNEVNLDRLRYEEIEAWERKKEKEFLEKYNVNPFSKDLEFLKFELKRYYYSDDYIKKVRLKERVLLEEKKIVLYGEDVFDVSKAFIYPNNEDKYFLCMLRLINSKNYMPLKSLMHTNILELPLVFSSIVKLNFLADIETVESLEIAIALNNDFLDSIDIYDKEILKRYLTFRYLKRQNFIYSKIQQKFKKMFFCLKPAKRRMFHEYFFNGDTFYNFFINSYNCVTDTWDFKEMLNKFPNISKELLDICMYMLEYIHELGFINMNFKLLINLDYNFLDLDNLGYKIFDLD